MKENNNNMYLVAMVAIVAVVALVVLLNGQTDSTPVLVVEKPVSDPISVSDENFIGQGWGEDIWILGGTGGT